jgi:hypothetical protein
VGKVAGSVIEHEYHQKLIRLSIARKGGLLLIDYLTMPLHRLPSVLEQILLEENWAR